MKKRLYPFFQRMIKDKRLLLEEWACYRISRSSTYPIEHLSTEPWDRTKPLISVVIPCYNHGHYLTDSVDSILDQTWQDVEIIIVNDGSTDSNTTAILEGFSRPKTRIIHHPENQGLPATRNTGIRSARGKYICCLDADDKLHPTYLEKAILVMETNLGIDFVYAYTQVFGEEDRVWYAPQFDPASLIYYNQLNPPGVFRKEAWLTVGGFREEMREGFEDWEFWIRLARGGYRGYRIPEKLIYVRRVGQSFIHRAMEHKKELIANIKRYNPEVYEDLHWLEEVKGNYREIYVSDPFLNLSRKDDYLPIQNDEVRIISRKAKEREVYERLLSDPSSHPSQDCLFISYQVMNELSMDAVMECTKYFYYLPYYLPRHTWHRFVNKLLLSNRSINKNQIIFD